MNCDNCGSTDSVRVIYGAFGEVCDKCAALKPMGKKKKVTPTMLKYIKSRYVGKDGHVKCNPKYKPSEHYLGS